MDKGGRPKKGNEKVDKRRAAELVSGGLTLREVGKIMDCSKVSIHKAVKGLLMPKEALDEFNNSKADIIASKEAQILLNLTTEDIQKASAYQKAGMFALLYDKERLERGQSTSNVAYYDIDSSHAKIAKQRLELLNRIGYSPSDQDLDYSLDSPDTITLDTP